MQNEETNKDQVEDHLSNRLELKFFLSMTLLFFIFPILIIQIPGIEKIGDAILAPFMKVIESR